MCQFLDRPQHSQMPLNPCYDYGVINTRVMSSFKFVRQKAGDYNITKNEQIVGSIKRVNASKWVVADVADTIQHVSKTLKDAKYAAENYMIFAVVDNTSKTVYNNSVRVDKHINSIELQRQMLENMSNLQVKVPTLEPICF